MTFRVGKRVGSKVEHAFDLSRTEDGGIRFTSLTALSDAERQLILAHYGRALKSKVVYRGEQHLKNFEPGTVQHFEHASHALPDPFVLMAKGA